ncbi:MAG: cytochrome ubiquinol oxidase subunit I, partial [Acidimicrobiales bacterium]
MSALLLALIVLAFVLLVALASVSAVALRRSGRRGVELEPPPRREEAPLREPGPAAGPGAEPEAAPLAEPAVPAPA